jgi:predicted hotdog family 3-hydroxylacyl-ACP dehydratase
MIQPPYPPVEELLPHTGRMVLLTAVVAHSRDATACVVDIRPDSAFLNAEGSVPPWVGVEYMAQCIAAHGGLRAKAAGEPIKAGFLLGSRSIEVRCTGFPPGQRLKATARHLWGESGYFSFECTLIDARTGAVLMAGNFNVLRLDDIQLGPRGIGTQ